MPKKKEEYIYCTFCGTKNEETFDNCTKCKKTLHPKNHLFKDFLYDHIKDDLKGKVEDNIFSYLKNFIISNLYGTVMTVSVVFTTAIVVTSALKPYKTVASFEEINRKMSSNRNEVTIKVYTYDDSCASDYDPFLAGVPFAFGGTISGLRRTMQEITIKKGTTINEYCQSGHESELICVEPVSLYDKSIEKDAKTYREKILAYATWTKTNSLEDDEEYYNWNMEIDELSYNLIPDDLEAIDKDKPIKKSTELFIPMVGCDYES